MSNHFLVSISNTDYSGLTPKVRYTTIYGEKIQVFTGTFVCPTMKTPQ